MSRGIIARGLGRAYGDPAQNAGGTVVQLRPGPIVLDPARGEVTAGGGVDFDELLRHLVPAWLVRARHSGYPLHHRRWCNRQ